MISAETTRPWRISPEKFTSADHPATIERTLHSISNDRLFMTMVSGLYRSGETVLTGRDAKNLLIGKPLDWEETISSAKVYFRDSCKVWNFFRTSVICTTHDTIYTSLPEKIHRLQRRRYFRVAPPVGCKASFRQQDIQFSSTIVSDISGGGMLISTDAESHCPDDQVKLRDITIRVPTGENGSGSSRQLPLIKEGMIVRSFTDGFTKRIYFGISFREELEVVDAISKYVIHREQQLLRERAKPLRNS
ncbi:MAG: PilZ domain-containing protein [Proteobacteria bacterium]|nr:PilZ domain-containing protein [Pseudomonadota bacterium]MBU1736670.1 PilZ domain-containing protein [Pseudomonadota bacterium]